MVVMNLSVFSVVGLMSAEEIIDSQIDFQASENSTRPNLTIGLEICLMAVTSFVPGDSTIG